MLLPLGVVPIPLPVPDAPELAPVEPLPMEPDPVVLEDPVEPIEPFDGLVVEEPVEPVASSVFLLQPLTVKAAARASAVAPANLSVGACISVSLNKLERLMSAKYQFIGAPQVDCMRHEPKHL